MNLLNNGASPIWLVGIAFLLSLVPMVVGLGTSYLKISIVLGMLRQGLGAQQVPGNIVVMALSFALTLMIMGPVLTECMDKVGKVLPEKFDSVPNKSELLNIAEALSPWRDFLDKHSGEREKGFVASLSKITKQKVVEENNSTTVEETKSETPGQGLLLSFLLTELKEAFSMGFVLLLPFLIIDLVVSNLLVGLGMFMVSPTMITLPLKLLVFVLCDGWMLLSRGLVLSYGTAIP